MPSQRIRASPTELVYCSVATRAKSAAKLLTIRSICILLICGHVVVVFLDARLELGHRVVEASAVAGLQLLLHLADERGVLVEQLAVLGADARADLLQVVLQRRRGCS